MGKTMSKFEDLHTFKLNHNLLVCFNISIITLLMSLLSISDSIFNIIIPFFPYFPNKLRLLYITFNLLWIICYRKIKFCDKDKHIKYQHILFNIFSVIMLLYSILLSISNLYITHQIHCYIINVMIVTIFLYLDLRQSFILLILHGAVYIFLVTYILSEQSFLYLQIAIILLSTLWGYYCMIIKLKNLERTFSRNKALNLSKKQLEEANTTLLNHEKARINFFTNTSQDLKSPVNVIYSAEQLLEKQLKNLVIDKNKCTNYIESIKINCFKLIRLVNNILDITKMQSSIYEIKLDNIDIVYTIESIVDAAASFIGSKGIDVIFDTTLEEKIISADGGKVERIILNLLSNAIKFTNPGGMIFINIFEDSNYLCISISDDGIGIDESMKESLFDRLFQTNKSLCKVSENSGSGLGLSIVNSLMLLHGGDVTFKSTYGVGSEFTLRFPNKVLDKPINYNEIDHKKRSYDNMMEKIQIEFSDI